MILPDKIVIPEKSLIVIGSKLLELIDKNEISIEKLYDSIHESMGDSISIEKTMLTLDFLFIIGKVEYNNETNKIRMR